MKPPRLVQRGDTSIGRRIFVEEADIREKVEHVTCHELTHAFTQHLQLPTWLHEGLAMVTMDQYFEKGTVQSDTLEVLARRSSDREAGGRYKVDVRDPDEVVYQYVRDYWLTRYIRETKPGLLTGLLLGPKSHAELESEVASAYGMGHQEFWESIDQTVAVHFKQE